MSDFPKDDLIDTLTDILIQTFSERGMGDDLIEIRQHLAKAEGLEIWEHDSQGDLHSLCSAFIQELLWYTQGERDTWGDDVNTCVYERWVREFAPDAYEMLQVNEGDKVRA